MIELLDKVGDAVFRARGGVSRWVSTDVGKVHAYEFAGKGEGTFVLVHGMAATATAFAAVVRHLRPVARRVLLVELPGHGRSERAARGLDVEVLATGIREAIDSLVDEGDPAVLLGTSLGGAAALRYTLERPARVRALVLASPAGAPLSIAELEEVRTRFAIKTRADARRFFADLLHAPPFYLRILESGIAKQLGSKLVQDFLASLGGSEGFTEAELQTLVPPVTLLWGASDKVLPRSGLAFYRRALPPTARIVDLEAVGHSAHIETPARLARELVDAYRRSAPPSPA